MPPRRPAQRVARLSARLAALSLALLPATCGAPARAAPTADGAAPAAAAQPAGDPLAALLGNFAAMPGLEAHFEEERHVALLEEPLRSSGTLYFAAPDHLLRRVEHPLESTLLLRGSELALASGGSVRRIDLDSQPLVRVLVDSFRLILSGDRAGLEALYAMQLEGSPAGDWQLRLDPREGPLARAVRSVELRGRGRSVRELHVRETVGDESVTRFSEVDRARRWSERERDAIFRLPDSP